MITLTRGTISQSFDLDEIRSLWKGGQLYNHSDKEDNMETFDNHSDKADNMETFDQR